MAEHGTGSKVCFDRKQLFVKVSSSSVSTNTNEKSFVIVVSRVFIFILYLDSNNVETVLHLSPREFAKVRNKK